MNKLNLGCGADYRKGYINLDYDKDIKTDIVFDINRIYYGDKLPFNDNQFEEVLLVDFLEHIIDPLPVLREVYRVCKVGGEIHIKVPLGNWVWDNLDHKRQFTFNCFDTSSFKFGHRDKKVLEMIKREKYYLPSKDFIGWLGRRLFNKSNLYVVYKKLEEKER